MIEIKKEQIALDKIRTADRGPATLNNDLVEAIQRSMKCPNYSTDYDRALARFEYTIAKEEIVRDFLEKLGDGMDIKVAIGFRLETYPILREEAEGELRKQLGERSD